MGYDSGNNKYCARSDSSSIPPPLPLKSITRALHFFVLYSLRRIEGQPDIRPMSVIRPIFNSKANNKNHDFPYNFIGYKAIRFFYKGNVGYKAKISENLVCGLICDVDCMYPRKQGSLHTSATDLSVRLCPRWVCV